MSPALNNARKWDLFGINRLLRFEIEKRRANAEDRSMRSNERLRNALNGDAAGYKLD